MAKKHQKHAKLTRPQLGFFGRNEWAIIGTPCGALQNIALSLAQQLSQHYSLAYVDADHHAAEDADDHFLGTGALVYTDKIAYHQFQFAANLDRYQYRNYFNDKDLILVNGNHFVAQRQIVVIDPKKYDSLQRKLDRLTEVQAFLLTEGISDIPDFLLNHLPAAATIPVFKSNELEKLGDLLLSQMQAALPPLHGLVLAGGKSQRMGQAKGLLEYHGKPQQEFMLDLLQQFCEQSFLSCRPSQMENLSTTYNLLPDSFQGLGPFGGILSAFRAYPNQAWLVVACDLPLLDQATLAYLCERRNPSKVATCFNSPTSEFPEPLISIWEPRSYPVLLQFLAQGYSCPRKVLINTDIESFDVPEPQRLMNVNRPEEYEQVKAILAKQAH